MHVRCANCQHTIEIDDGETAREIHCPNCGNGQRRHGATFAAATATLTYLRIHTAP